MKQFEEAIGSRLEDLMFAEPQVCEPKGDQQEQDSESDEAERFEAEPDEAERFEAERDEPEREELQPREPLEQGASPAGSYTMHHTVLTRSVYAIMTQQRSIQKQSWQLRARINCSKGVLLVNTTMEISSSHSTSEQESLANTHLDFLIVQAATIKRRNKKPKQQSSSSASTTTDAPVRRRSCRVPISTPSPTKFSDAKKDGRSSNGYVNTHGPPGTSCLHRCNCTVAASTAATALLLPPPLQPATALLLPPPLQLYCCCLHRCNCTAAASTAATALLLPLPLQLHCCCLHRCNCTVAASTAAAALSLPPPLQLHCCCSHRCNCTVAASTGSNSTVADFDLREHLQISQPICTFSASTVADFDLRGVWSALLTGYG
jgi:hypothetical protein